MRVWTHAGMLHWASIADLSCLVVQGSAGKLISFTFFVWLSVQCRISCRVTPSPASSELEVCSPWLITQRTAWKGGREGDKGGEGEARGTGEGGRRGSTC